MPMTIKEQRYQRKLNDLVDAGLAFFNSLSAGEKQFLFTTHGNAFAKLVTECELVAQMLVNEQKFNALKEGQKT